MHPFSIICVFLLKKLYLKKLHYGRQVSPQVFFKQALLLFNSALALSSPALLRFNAEPQFSPALRGENSFDKIADIGEG